jgi:hypothetical protein
VVTLAQVLARHWPGYQRRYGARVLPSHRRAVQAILACRTPALGGQRYRCAACGRDHFAYHSCRHRACPQCGHADATHWIAQQKTRLLPGVPYFLVTFTVPAELRGLIRARQRELYAALFRESAATLQEVAAHEKYLGAELGLLGVLHTWTRQLIYHPHIHYVVAGAGLSADGLRWLRVRSADFFLPEKVLARRFRHRLRRALALAHPEWFATLPPQAWRVDWVVDSIAVGAGASALKYLSAYVYRTALGNDRILADDERGVTFRFRRSDNGRWQTVSLAPAEFLRRFLQHVVPRGFQRVRSYGWLAPAAKARWQRIEALLDWHRPAPPPVAPVPPPECPRCHQPMIAVQRLPRAPP